MGSKPAHQLTMTHRGEITEYGTMGAPWRSYTAVLRETKRYWISSQGVKFRKADGACVGERLAYSLDLKSVAQLVIALER
jgi:hypothetical protein